MPVTRQFDPDQTLERAMQVFWSCGYESTSVGDLVRETQVNRASLYATFGNKRALFLGALRRYDERFRKQRLHALEHSATSPRAAIQALFEGWIERATIGNDQRGCLLVNTTVEIGDRDATVRALVAETQRDTERFFRTRIELGQARGEIAATIDPRRTAKMLLATLLGLLVLVRTRPEPELLRAIVEEAIETI